jgi:hypothetical protein
VSASAFIGGSTGFITTWYDQSGNGYDLVQATAGSQPGYSATAINSLPGMTFNASTGQWMTRTLIPNGTGTAVGICLVVAAITNSTSNYGGAGLSLFTTTSLDYNSAYGWATYSRDDMTQNLFTEANSNSTSDCAITYGTPYQGYAHHIPGTGLQLWIDRTASNNSTPAASNWGGDDSNNFKITVGGRNDGSGHDGSQSECILYITDVSANRVAMSANQQSYWGTP